jgi:bleomycin hydrolase
VSDGGQYDMFVGLVNKYGLVPKSEFQESRHSSNSAQMNNTLKKILRFYACELWNETNLDVDYLRNIKTTYIAHIYNVLSKFLGTPPQNDQMFNWSYMDKNKKYECHNDLTPILFYKEYVKPCYDVEEHISIIHDPRDSESKYLKTYTVEFLGSVTEERQIKHLNLPIERLKELVKKSLDNNQPVWFGCDVSKCFARCVSLLDVNVIGDDKLLNYPENINMTKANRLVWNQSLMTHAMLFTGYNLNNEFEVENSWGSAGTAGTAGTEGYLKMTSEWFDQYVFQIVINKNMLLPEELEIYQTDAIVVPLWDPFGSLAY